MTNSAAWTSLSVGAVWVYIELRKSFNPRRGGNSCLVLPYSEVQWKMNARTYRLKKQELIDKGFIRVVDPGGLYKRPSVYELSNEWERISLEIVDKEGKEAIKFRKKTYPQKLPPGLRNSIEEKKKRNEKQYMEIY
ncbi:MAG: hypothetical protein ACOC5F_02900 [Candidatus Aminicenantaceae bacterium]